MSARVYLFADFGKGPRVLSRDCRTVDGLRAANAAEVFRLSPRQQSYRNARAWWLVECEGAEAGRECIEYARAGCNSAEDGLPPGRILDSGRNDAGTEA